MKTIKSAGSAVAVLFSVSAWAVMPSAGEPVVHERAAAPAAKTSATTRQASSQTDAPVALHPAAAGA